MKTLRIILSLCFTLLFAVIGGNIFASVLDIGSTIPVITLCIASMMPTPQGTFAINVFTAPGGVATPFQFQMNYLPQLISFTNVVPLTSLRVETAEDGVLHDWTAAGLVAMSGFKHIGALPANIVQYRLADGELRPKNVTISGVTSAAGAVPFFVSSDKIGKLPFRSKNAAILGNQPTLFEKFSALFIPTLATATDRVEIKYKSGLQQTLAMEDIRNSSAIWQEAAGIIIDNTIGYIETVHVTCVAALTPAYILSVYLPV